MILLVLVECPNCDGSGTADSGIDRWWIEVHSECRGEGHKGTTGPFVRCTRCRGTGRIPGARSYPKYISSHCSGTATETCLDYVESIDDDMVLHCRGLGRIEMQFGLRKPRAGTAQYADLVKGIRELCQGREIEVGIVSSGWIGEPSRDAKGNRVGEDVRLNERALEEYVLRSGLCALTGGPRSPGPNPSVEAERSARESRLGIWRLPAKTLDSVLESP